MTANYEKFKTFKYKIDTSNIIQYHIGIVTVTVFIEKEKKVM